MWEVPEQRPWHLGGGECRTGPLLDTSQYTDYNATDSVSRYLNLAPVKVCSRRASLENA